MVSSRGKKAKKIDRTSVVFLVSMVLWFVVCLLVINFFVGGDAEPQPEVSAVASSPATATPSASLVRRDVAFPDVRNVDRNQAEGVARAAVASLATWDSRDDRGYGEAVRRTVPLFDEALAERVSSGELGEPVAWAGMAKEHEAFSSPQVMDYDIFSDYTNDVREASGVSRDGRELRFMQFAVRWNWLGRDGTAWADEGKIRVYELVMVKGDNGWSVASYAWRDEAS